MPLADAADTHHETDLAGVDSALVGMHHHARVTEGGALNGELAREGGTKQETAGRGQFALRVEAVGELDGMPEERLGQSTMATPEPLDHIVIASLHLIVGQLQDALENGGGAGFLLIEALVTWDEKAGDDA